jgi:4-hydroxybenzoate polyprenyltransferase
MDAALPLKQTALSRLNPFLALSRTPHLLLDLATPGLAALLCLGAFPPAHVLLLGLFTAFAGYTAVYALNDIADYRVDCRTLKPDALPMPKPDLDAVFVLHPLARGLLSRREAVIWTAGWAGAALIGASLLNPLCPAIFLFAFLLEVLYCSLLRITWFRSVISGFVKTSGPVAAVIAVHPDPPFAFLAILFLWLFFWEIGGQNIPNDLADLETDRLIGARTVPVRFGPRRTILIILGSLSLALALSLIVFFLSPVRPGLVYLAGALFSGFYFLLLPWYCLSRSGSAGGAFHLFNRASYYPVAMLLVTILSWVA